MTYKWRNRDQKSQSNQIKTSTDNVRGIDLRGFFSLNFLNASVTLRFQMLFELQTEPWNVFNHKTCSIWKGKNVAWRWIELKLVGQCDPIVCLPFQNFGQYIWKCFCIKVCLFFFYSDNYENTRRAKIILCHFQTAVLHSNVVIVTARQKSDSWISGV